MLLAKCRNVVARGGDIEAPDTGRFEGRRRIVRCSLDRRLQRRRCDRDIEPIIRGHLEQAGLAGVLHEFLAGLAVALEHLGVGRWRSMTQLFEHHAHHRGTIGWSLPFVARGDLAGERDHPVASVGNDRPRL